MHDPAEKNQKAHIDPLKAAEVLQHAKPAAETKHMETIEAEQPNEVRKSPYPSCAWPCYPEKRRIHLVDESNKYTAYSIHRILKRLISTNPQIINPNNVEAGTRIHFPAIRFEVKSPDADCWWVYLDEEDRLDAAFEKLREYPKDAPPVRLVPQCIRRRLEIYTCFKEIIFLTGKKQNGCFTAFRRNFLKQQEYFPDGKTRETVFFADPFLS